MAKGSRSALKNLRKSEKRKIENKAVRTKIKNTAKKINGLVTEKKKDEAVVSLVSFSSIVDRAAKKGIVHKNTAARKKSRLQKKINTLS
ncbi:MAG: 30S ribosomal protein S20 [Spirochaetales bacterium]|nr:30S ribosomal protein S20 [Spirochaetales bacterium]